MGVSHVTTTAFDQTTLSATHTISTYEVSAGSSLALIIMVAIEIEGRTVSGITFNTTENFTVKSTHTGTTGTPDSRIEIWRLLAPTVTTADIVISLAGGTATFSGGVTQCRGVHQTVPLGTAVASDAGTANASVTVSDGAAGDLVLDCLHESAGGATAGAGQAGRYDNSGGTSYFSHGSTEPGGASVTMSWSHAASPRHLVAINIFQAPDVPQAYPRVMYRGRA